MAVAPGRKKHVAGYLQHTVRYSRDTPLEVRTAGENTAGILSSFFILLHFCPESTMPFFFFGKMRLNVEHQVSSGLLRNLRPNEYVCHLAHSSRVHDPCFNWIKGLK